MEYYRECWIDRNETSCNQEMQRSRMIEWHETEKQAAVRGQNLQVKKYNEDKALKVEELIIEHVKKWLHALKELKRRLEKHKNKEDVRYFLLNNKKVD